MEDLKLRVLDDEAIETIEARQAEITLAAESLEITNQERYAEAREIRAGIKAMVGRIQEAFRPIIKSCHETWKRALEKEKEYLRPWLDADARLRDKSEAYIVELRKKEEIAAEARRKAEENKKKIQEEAVAKAVKLDEAGKTAEANKVLDKAAEEETRIYVPPPPKPVETPGDHLRTLWKFKVTNPDMVPRHFCSPDWDKINEVVQAKHEAASIPGVEVYQEKVLVSRDRRPKPRG